MKNFSDSPGKIVIIYAATSAAWILFSDSILSMLVFEPSRIAFWATLKGWMFVVVTSLLLFILINRYIASLRQANASLTNSNEQLTAAHEELLSIQEELQQQFEELQSQTHALQERDEKLIKHNAFLNTLHDTALNLLHGLSRERLLQALVNRICEVTQTPHAFIFLLNHEENVLELKLGAGVYHDDIGYLMNHGEGVVGKVWASKLPLCIENYAQWEGRAHNKRTERIRGIVAVPMILDGKFIGAIGASRLDDATPFTEEDIDFLNQFGTLASLALDNIKLFQDLQHELSQRELVEQALRSSRTRYQQLFENMLDAFAYHQIILDKEGQPADYVFLEVNAAFENMIGLTRSSIIGKRAGELFPRMLAAELQLMEKYGQAAIKDQDSRFEYFMNSSGRWFSVAVFSPQPGYFVSVFEDITERKNAAEQIRHHQEQLQYISMHDGLTGLYNRGYFEEEMKRIGLRRNGTVGLIICDVDGLKLINDTLGHETGDQILKATADILRNAFRDSDVIARIGGDEFAIILAPASVDTVKKSIERIRDGMSLFNNQTERVFLSISMGWALSSDTNETPTYLYKEADSNMYREKLHRSQSSRSALIRTLVKAMEARDFLTGGHAERLESLCTGMGKSLGLSEAEISDLQLLARFHDLGKVGIPEAILFKSDPLTESERNEIKRHPEIGCRIAQSAPDLIPIADYILKHHEWWNGAGYPLGIAGESIPLECRILSIIDAYDAMTSDRPYRPALSEEAAREELSRCAGTQFDPALVALFLSLQ